VQIAMRDFFNNRLRTVLGFRSVLVIHTIIVSVLLGLILMTVR